MLRIAALLGAAMALGTFGATLTHQLRALFPGVTAEAATAHALGGLASFIAGLTGLGVGVTLLLQRPDARAERALYVASLAAAVHFFLEAGGASVLSPGFGLARDAAAVVAALGLTALAAFVTAPPRRFATLVAALGPLAWFLLPRPLAWLVPAGAALLIALVGRQSGRAFTVRQQATWLTAGLVALVGGGLAAAVLAPLGVGWTRDLAALVSLAVPFTAALSLQKVRLMEADRIVATLGVGSVLFAGALVATQAIHLVLEPLPGERRALLSGFCGLMLLLLAARLREPAAASLLDRLFPERRRLYHALADAPGTLVQSPFDPWSQRLAVRLTESLGRESATVWRVDSLGHLRGFDERGRARHARLRPQGRLWVLASVFGAPLAADDLGGVPLEPSESHWLGPHAERRDLVPIVFEDRLVGFLELLAPAPLGGRPAPPLSDEAWRALAAFADLVSAPFAAAVLRVEAEAEIQAASRLALGRERLQRSRDARMMQRGLQGLAGYLRRRASGPTPDAEEVTRQLGVCEALLSECAMWESPVDRHLLPLGPLLDQVFLARAGALRDARVQIDTAAEIESLFVYSDPTALSVVLVELLDGVLGVLAHFDGPRAVRVLAAPVPEAPGFLRLCLCDSGPNRTPPPGEPPGDPLSTALLRSLGARRHAETHADANATCLELPMVGH